MDIIKTNFIDFLSQCVIYLVKSIFIFAAIISSTKAYFNYLLLINKNSFQNSFLKILVDLADLLTNAYAIFNKNIFNFLYLDLSYPKKRSNNLYFLFTPKNDNYEKVSF